MALAFDTMNQHVESLAAQLRLIEIEKNPIGHFNLGLSYQYLGLLEQAIL